MVQTGPAGPEAMRAELGLVHASTAAAIIAAPPAAASGPKRWQLAVKRTADLLLLLFLVPVAVPAMLLIAVLVKITSPGPVLFRQERVGRGGSTFTMLKFRSMATHADVELRSNPEEYARYVANGFKLAPLDQRITQLGRFLRKTSLDELPQLINVLLGHASLVGVRPLLTDDFAARSAPDRELYVLHRPGLTGLWQVSGRSSIAHEERMQMDRRYLESWRLRTDLRLLLRTPLAVLRTRHAA